MGAKDVHAKGPLPVLSTTLARAIALAFAAIALALAFAAPALALELEPSVIAPDGASLFTYADAYDTDAKYEGGYVRYNDPTGTRYASDGAAYVAPSAVNGWVDQSDYVGRGPHGGYDTTTNKCKVCHATHRAQGTYYLLRASDQNDACSYCHVDGPAFSSRIVYTNDDAGMYAQNGHTIGSGVEIPGSTVAMEITQIIVGPSDSPIEIDVRAYDAERKRIHRIVPWGRGTPAHPRTSVDEPAEFARIGPLRLSCMSCHQVHNALDQVWQPTEFVTGPGATPNGRLETGYKLLRRFPGATVAPGTPIEEGFSTASLAKVPETTLIAGFNYSDTASAETTYVEFGTEFRQPDWVVANQFSGEGAARPDYDPRVVSEYALSVWCADCHNLSIGGVYEDADPEKADIFVKAHSERTHPVPAADGMQCYSCHRNDLGDPLAHDLWLGLNYSPADYRFDSETSDFPHSGDSRSIKLLGAFSLASPPPADGSPWDPAYAEVIITADNLDAVCLRCHVYIGVHE